MRVAVFVSGRGSNLQAILNSQKERGYFEVKAVFSDKKDCAAFGIAGEHSIPTYCLGSKGGCVSYNDLSALLTEQKIELVVLAGFLKMIPEDLIKRYNFRIINIHPALLPSFGGKGMYGMNVHRAVFESAAKVSGATVHFVDMTYDTGKIIAQRCVDISDVKSPEEIAERVLQAEHELLPFVIEKIARNEVKIIDGRPVILN